MSQYIGVQVPHNDTTVFKEICDAKRVPYSQLFTDALSRIVSNPVELGQIIVQRIIDKAEPKKDVGTVTLYLGREMHRKFIEISDSTLISRSSLATLIIQYIIQQEKQIVQQGT